MEEKMYICGYKHCLHPDKKVGGNESVIVGKRHYHTECAELRNEIRECANLYLEKTDDKTIYPTALRVINTMIFKSGIPVSYVKNSIKRSQAYYSNKPVMALYGIRKNFYREMEKEFIGRR